MKLLTAILALVVVCGCSQSDPPQNTAIVKQPAATPQVVESPRKMNDGDYAALAVRKAVDERIAKEEESRKSATTEPAKSQVEHKQSDNTPNANPIHPDDIPPRLGTPDDKRRMDEKNARREYELNRPSWICDRCKASGKGPVSTSSRCPVCGGSLTLPGLYLGGSY